MRGGLGSKRGSEHAGEFRVQRFEKSVKASSGTSERYFSRRGVQGPQGSSEPTGKFEARYVTFPDSEKRNNRKTYVVKMIVKF